MSYKQLNILQFICPTGFYGAERWVLALVKHLPSNKTRCDLAVTLEGGTTQLKIVKKFKQECGEVFEVPMSHRFDIKVTDKLVKLIQERDIHIIHTHGYKSDILGIIAARKAGIKSIVTPHGFENTSDLKLRLFIWLGIKAMKYADVIAPLSKQLSDDVHKAGIEKNKIHYIQNGVDLSEVEAQRTTNPSTEKSSSRKIIGFIGQLISRKNVFDILDIFNSLAVKHPDIELQIIGDGEQRHELEYYAAQLSHQDKVNFMGFRDDRLEILKDFDLFVMTSAMEGIPRCLMEACAMGIPVAAYNIPGIDQLITHQKTGLLAEPRDKDTLLQYWEDIITDQALAKRLAENARQFVTKNYSAKRMADQYLELYGNIIA